MLDAFQSEDDLRAFAQQTAESAAPHIDETTNVVAPHIDETTNVAPPPINETTNVAPPPINETTNVAPPHIDKTANIDVPHIDETTNVDVPHIDEYVVQAINFAATNWQATNMNFSHVDQVDDVGTVENVALLEARQAQINFHREQSRNFQMEQAERMVKRSRIELAQGQKGDNVAIPIPLVDRGRGDPRNILAVILDRSENNN
ncbi:hypothetical protein ElyMa_004805700 [Elysia marginata]|uniref:Uncharacterized protein n=1 Tax=Elysia marginata TaxID=1093978 RepID=A0AAV4IIM8_9GAST|nr:hypothetical protein ElyMa_004805700 [Elysia marginata]